MEPISSIQNPRVKLVASLQQRARTRRKEGKIVLEGTRLVRDACLSGEQPDFIFYDADTLDTDFLTFLLSNDLPLIPVTPKVLQHVTETPDGQGVLGVFPMPQPQYPEQLERILILDAIRDPGNMGTMLRTAAAAGVQAVILAPDCVDAYNPKTLRAGMGAHFRVPFIEMDWAEIASLCNDKTIYLAAGDGDLVYTDVDWTDHWALIIGSEAHGATHAARSLATYSVRIPMAAETESLNAAAAAAVILFETQRQRWHNT